VEPVERVKGRLTAVREVIEEEEAKIEEWNKKDKIEQIGDILNKL